MPPKNYVRSFVRPRERNSSSSPLSSSSGLCYSLSLFLPLFQTASNWHLKIQFWRQGRSHRLDGRTRTDVLRLHLGRRAAETDGCSVTLFCSSPSLSPSLPPSFTCERNRRPSHLSARVDALERQLFVACSFLLRDFGRSPPDHPPTATASVTGSGGGPTAQRMKPIMPVRSPVRPRQSSVAAGHFSLSIMT